jgi:hypothetical protein
MHERKTAVDLPVGRDGFRIRGGEMTRTETFTDAAFAFAVTLLVISVDAVPASFPELRAALAGVPAFAASFALLAIFWHGHWQWSRRFGLEDMPTILLSFGLVFVMLSYVYPLKFLTTLAIAFFSRDASAAGMIANTGQLYDLFVIYGAGFVTMSLVILGLNAHALRKRVELALDEYELFQTKAEVGGWAIVAGVGVLSIVLARLTEPPVRYGDIVWPGWIYMALAFVMPAYGVLTGRRARRIERAPAAPLAASESTAA